MATWGTLTQRKQLIFRGDRMKLLRKARGWAQSYMAEQCQVSRTQIVNLENGVSEPSLKVLTLAASILATSTDYLLDMTSDMGSQYKTVMKSELVTIKQVVTQETEVLEFEDNVG